MRCDVLIIGGGQAATPLAHAVAAAGQTAVLAERRHLGGSCVNFGCTPTKAAIASARLARQARRAQAYGLRIPQVEVDFPAVLARARRIVEDMRGSLESSLESTDNPRLVRGHARLTGRSDDGIRADVGGQEIVARHVVLDTGTRTKVPPIDGIDGVEILDAGNWLDRPELPIHLAIIGGGYVGLEMAQFYRRMGSEVTVIESGGQIAEHEDEDVARVLQDLLAREGVGFHLNARLAKVTPQEGGLHLALEGEKGLIVASHLFVATGRQPNTDDLGLETVGVELDDKGFVRVDERLATSVPGIWAAGDIRGGPMFTHTAWDDGRVLQSQLLGDGARRCDRIVPYAIFTDPELGRVGLTEAEARRTGKSLKIARFDMSSNGKAKEIGEPDGLIKVVLDAADETILGAAVLAADGAELVHVYIDLMNAGAPVRAIRDAVHIHPTLAEATQTALASVAS